MADYSKETKKINYEDNQLDYIEMSPQPDKKTVFQENLDATVIKESSQSAVNNIDQGKLIDTIIEGIGLNKHILSIYLIISLFLLADGGEMIVLSLLITKLGTLWGLSELQKGLLGSGVFVGFFIGSLASGKLSDLKGRKVSFVIGSLFVSIFGIGSALASNYNELIILRMLFGFGIGLSVPAISSLTTEITKIHWRAWVLNCLWIFFPIGEILAVIEAKYLLNSENGWRYLLGIVGLPCLICFILSFFVYESPRFYLSTKQYDKAFMSLNRYLISSKLPELSENQKNQLKLENEEEILKNEHKSDFSQLFSKDFIRLTLLSCTIFFISSFVYYGLIFIQPQIFDESLNENSTQSLDDQSSKMYYGLILAAMSEIPATIITSCIANMKIFGRIKSMALGFLLSLLSASLCFYIKTNKYIYMTMLKFSIGFPFGIIFIYTCEAYPTKFRTIGIGLNNSVTRIGGITTTFLSQLSLSYKVSLPFFNFSVLCFIGFIASLLLPYETLGRNII